MTHPATYLAVGLTVIVLASSFGTVAPIAKANPGSGPGQLTHHSTPPAENGTTDAVALGAKSQPISTGELVVASIEGGETKRYAFTAEAGRMIRVVHNDIRNPATLTLYDPDGEAIARDTTRGKYRHSFGTMTEQTGTYTLEVQSENSTLYQFVAETRNPDYVSSYENVANDDRGTALAIDEDRVNLTSVLTEGEEDWYAVDLEKDERLNVTVSHEPSGPYDGALAFDLGNGMEVDAFDTEGRAVGQLDSPITSTGSDWSEYGEAKQTVLADAAGTYYIRVSNSSYMGGFAEYEMTINVTDAETRTSTPIRTSSLTPSTHSPIGGLI